MLHRLVRKINKLWLIKTKKKQFLCKSKVFVNKYIETGESDDMVVSGNGETDKGLTTVAKTVINLWKNTHLERCILKEVPVVEQGYRNSIISKFID